ncbi:hypothetical protein AWB71_05321 [Caballeronia peredens]|nr:hypothetical protein AWB71_05321 [Caballeronia peredens]
MTTTIAIFFILASVLFACTVNWGDVFSFIFAAFFAAAESVSEKIASFFK